MSPPPAVVTQGQSSNFDKLAFPRYMKKRGKVYRTQALELISLCRIVVRTHQPSLDSYSRLRDALRVVDDALDSAADVERKTSIEVDEKFERAIGVLRDFKRKFPFKDSEADRKWDETLDRVTAAANPKDRSWVTVDALKEKLQMKRTGNEWQEPTRVVKFVLLRALHDEQPVTVNQVLNENATSAEVLWNFCRLKDERRLTLEQNPHFYTGLPLLSQAYGGRFKMEPIEHFPQGHTFYVLTDRPGHVYIKTDGYSQCFGNVWCPNGAVIFKELSGSLEGEAIITASLKSTPPRFCKQPPVAITQSLGGPKDGRRRWPTLTLRCPCENWKHQIDTLSDSRVIILRICAMRALPDSALLAPLPPISEQPQYSVAYRAHIHMLNYDSLLGIFNHYRMQDADSWNIRLKWLMLAHVCRRWRYLIYDSSSLLDLCLFFNGSFSIDLLAHLPPLPLIIRYLNETTTRVRKYEESILPGLQQHGRLRSVALQAPSPGLCILLRTMDEYFPMLENLSLLSTTGEEANIVLPSTFRAPNLRHLALHGVGLPSGLSLFTSTTTLITLTLTCIPAPYYFHPGQLVTQLQGLLRLEELSIGFAVPIPLPSTEGELLPPPMPQVTLPTLQRLMFRGVAVYLENLVAQINAPLLEQLIVTLFFEISFTLASLTQFIHTTGGLACISAKVLFKRECVSIFTNNGESLSSRSLTISVNCEHLDWQIDAVTQCCRALEQVLSAVEELTLDLDEDGMPSDWDDSVDSTLWHGLLLPFSGVKRLQIAPSLTCGLSDALKPDAAVLDLDLLPELQQLEVQLEVNDANKAFATFIETRELGGRPVELLVPRSLGKSQTGAHVRPTEEHVHLEEDETNANAADKDFKPVFLKGLFSVATTSTKPPAVLKTDIRRVLDRMTVQYRETQTGFDCIHLPSIDISSLHDPHGAPQKTRDLGGATPQQQQPHVSPPPTGGVTDPEVSESVGRNMLSVRFEINIVKVPWLPLHGIQFRRAGGDGWQYQMIARRVLTELKL